MNKLISFVFVAATAVIAPASAAADSAAFEKAVETIGESGDFVGLAAAVVRGEDITFMETYGVRQAGRPAKITPTTTFRIASLSKAFAATAAVDLNLEGKLSLGDKISAYNADFALKNPSHAKAATLEHVLSHRLSLPPYAYDNLLEAHTPPAKILREMKKVTPICDVGTCYGYQNVGFNMITSAIEKAEARPYADVVTDRIFTPLEMSGASFGRENLKRTDNWARSHRGKKSGTWKERPVKQPYYDVPAAGGVNASLLDMTKWLSANMGKDPETVSAAMRIALHKPRVRTPGETRRMRRMRRTSDTHYGLGWRIYKYAGETVVTHSGGVEGYNAQIAFIPSRDVGIVLLANSRSKKFWTILPAFLDAELGLSNPLLTP